MFIRITLWIQTSVILLNFELLSITFSCIKASLNDRIFYELFLELCQFLLHIFQSYIFVCLENHDCCYLCIFVICGIWFGLKNKIFSGSKDFFLFHTKSIVNLVDSLGKLSSVRQLGNPKWCELHIASLLCKTMVSNIVELILVTEHLICDCLNRNML